MRQKLLGKKSVLFTSVLNHYGISNNQLNTGNFNKQIFPSKYCQMPKLLLVFVCIRDACVLVCALVCKCARAHVCTCLWRTEDELGCQSQSVSAVFLAQSCTELETLRFSQTVWAAVSASSQGARDPNSDQQAICPLSYEEYSISKMYFSHLLIKI